MTHRALALLAAVVLSLFAAYCRADAPRDARKPMLDEQGRTTFPTKGNRFRGLVIPVQFADRDFSIPDIELQLDEMLNKKGYDKDNAIGSAADYFDDCSLGAFRPQFDVAERVTLAKGAEYYAGIDGNDNFREAVEEAIAVLIARRTDMAKYDCNNDGFIDSFVILFAGHARAERYEKNLIKPHHGSLDDSGFQIDGKFFGDYACVPELRGRYWDKPKLQGIGPFCREFLHSLGLPYLSMPEKSVATDTPAEWSVMADGMLNGDADCPPALSAFELWTLRWLEFTELTETPESIPSDIRYIPDTHLELPSLLSPDRAAVRLYARTRLGYDRDLTEYFILETRGTERWDAALPSCGGMLVWRIDYETTSWSNDQVNAYGISRAVPLPSEKFLGNYLLGYDIDRQWYTQPTDSYLPALTPGYAFPTEMADISFHPETQTTTLTIAPSERPECHLATTILTPQKLNESTLRLRWDDAGPGCSYMVSVTRTETAIRRIYLNGCNSIKTGECHLDISGISDTDRNQIWKAEVRVVDRVPSTEISISAPFIPSECDYPASAESVEADSAPRPYVSDGKIIAPENAAIYTLDGRPAPEGRLHSGIYIVRYGSKALKIAVK